MSLVGQQNCFEFCSSNLFKSFNSVTIQALIDKTDKERDAITLFMCCSAQIFDAWASKFQFCAFIFFTLEYLREADDTFHHQKLRLQTL